MVYSGICNYCFGINGKLGFAFIALSSGFHLILIIETNKGYIYRVYNCDMIRFQPGANLDPSKRIDVKENR
jgi:hypothetical protein